ncbi:MAG: response regulator transcription factor [Firmicutes bacterium]|nr:response regulator transcription factor [Bacillota bacterium]
MEYRINLVEDEPNLNQLLSSYLRQEGWRVHSFLDGGEARAAILERPHLWILDIMLPEVDGYQLLREIKADSPRMPVVFISARDADIDRIVGLEMGSEDYVAKPFTPRELVIRTRRLLDRAYGGNYAEWGELEQRLRIDPYLVDEPARMVYEGETPLELTSREFDLLLYFAKRPGYSLSREQILRHVWGEDYFGSDRVVDDLVRRLRKKLPALRLETVYGYGYRVVKA